MVFRDFSRFVQHVANIGADAFRGVLRLPYIIQFPDNDKLFQTLVAQAHFKVWSSDFYHYLFATSKEIPSFENSSDGIDCGKSIRFLPLRLLFK